MTSPLWQYVMVGQLTGPPWQSVYWKVYNTPDTTGLYSGYFGQLQNIAVASSQQVTYPSNNTPTLDANSLNGIPIANSPAPANNQVLLYDSTSNAYVPGNAALITILVTTLRTTLPVVPSGENTISVSGYTASGDGGGGTFVWNPTDTRAADGGTIIAVTGIATGRWNRVFYGSYDPRWFGAKGDSTYTTAGTDNYSALQAAINAAAVAGNAIIGVKGGTVLLPAGYFGFTQTLNVPDNVTIQGQGARYLGPGNGGQFGSVLAWKGGTSGTAMQVLATSADVRDVLLKNFVLCGNFGSGAGTANTVTGLLLSGVGGGGGHAVTNFQADHIFVCEFNTCVNWGGGDLLDSEADNSTFRHCQFWYFNSTGIAVTSQNAGDASELYSCLFNTNPAFSGTIDVDLQRYGFMTLKHCVGLNSHYFVKRNVSVGNNLTLENCETEGCDRFLYSTGSGKSTVTMIACSPNNAIELTGIDRVVAFGNLVGGTDHTGTAVGLILAAGCKWMGYGNLYLPERGWLLNNAAGGVFYEDSASLDVIYPEYYEQGHVIREAQAQDGLGNPTGLVSYAYGKLCARTGWLGGTWAALTTYQTGDIVVASPDNAHAFKVTAGGGGASGVSQPSWNTSSGGTTSDGALTWTEIGASAFFQNFGPPGHQNVASIPGGQFKKGSVVWNPAAQAAGQACGWIAIADTVGAVAGDWRSFGIAWGSDDGLTPAFNFPLQGSALETKPLAVSQNTITMTDADIVLSASQAATPHLTFAGATLSTDRKVTFPTITAGQAAQYIVQNNNSGGHNLLLDAGGGLQVTVPPNATVRVDIIGINVQPIPAYINAQPARAAQITDNSTGAVTSAVADVGASFSQSGLNNIHATLLDRINKIEAALFNLGITK